MRTFWKKKIAQEEIAFDRKNYFLSFLKFPGKIRGRDKTMFSFLFINLVFL